MESLPIFIHVVSHDVPEPSVILPNNGGEQHSTTDVEREESLALGGVRAGGVA